MLIRSRVQVDANNNAVTIADIEPDVAAGGESAVDHSTHFLINELQTTTVARTLVPEELDPARAFVTDIQLSGRISLQQILKEFESLIEQFIDMIEMIIEAIIQAFAKLIDSLFLQLTRLADVIAQYLEMAPEDHLQLFMDRLIPLARLAKEKKEKGFPHSAVNPLELFRDAQGRIRNRIGEWVEKSGQLLEGAGVEPARVGMEVGS